MKIRPCAGWSDIDSILDRLSDQHREEYESLGYPEEPFMANMAEFMANSDVQVLEFDGLPQALLAVRPSDPIATTWLMVTKEFFAKPSIATVRLGRRYMEGCAAKYGPILSVSHAKHPKMAKWLKTIGFEQINDKVFLFRT